MILTLALFSQLAAQCAGSVHVDTLAAIARTESGFHTDAIFDNKTRRAYFPASRNDAVALANNLVLGQKHSVDMGLMQINSNNLTRFGMTLADAFDPCRNLAAAAQVLVAAYAPVPSTADVQPALRQALSRYNTGSPTRGFRNGYVAKVQVSADLVVPAIRVSDPHSSVQHDTARVVPPPPPGWDVYAQARYVRDYGPGTQSAVALPPAPAESVNKGMLLPYQNGAPSALHREADNVQQ